jgi:putative transposase
MMALLSAFPSVSGEIGTKTWYDPKIASSILLTTVIGEKARGNQMPKQATPVVLRKEERTALVQFTKQHRSAQQLVLRARIVLNAGEGHRNAETARLLSVSAETVRLWRDRWAALQGIDLKDRGVEERLADAPRPGTPGRISAEQRCQMELLACEAPSQSGRPISQWSGREIAAEMVQRGIVERISRRHAARLRKYGASSPIGSATGSRQLPMSSVSRRSMKAVNSTRRQPKQQSEENGRSAWTN